MMITCFYLSSSILFQTLQVFPWTFIDGRWYVTYIFVIGSTYIMYIPCISNKFRHQINKCFVYTEKLGCIYMAYAMYMICILFVYTDDIPKLTQWAVAADCQQYVGCCSSMNRCWKKRLGRILRGSCNAIGSNSNGKGLDQHFLLIGCTLSFSVGHDEQGRFICVLRRGSTSMHINVI